MNEAELKAAKAALPDVQEEIDTRNIPIDKVGIRGATVPIRVIDSNGDGHHTVGVFSAYSHLEEKYKGVSMSRFAEIIHETVDDVISLDIVKGILKQIRERLEGKDSYVKMKFSYFMKKEAPVSKKVSYFHIPCIIEGKSIDGEDKIYLTTKVNYQSACPCSKEISKYNSHNQRSFANVKMELKQDEFLSIEDVVALIESVVSCPIYNLLKRPDEKYVTERVYERPKFVEDTIRDMYLQFKELLDVKINDFVLVVEHEESIHQMNAVAVKSAGRLLG